MDELILKRTNETSYYSREENQVPVIWNTKERLLCFSGSFDGRFFQSKTIIRMKFAMSKTIIFE
jgi:hypothetical protein